MSPSDHPDDCPTRARRPTAEWLAPGVCVLIGLALAVLPHVLWQARLGTPVYFANSDDLLYLSIVGQAAFNHPLRLADPMHAGPGDSLYPWIQFVPTLLTAQATGLGPAGVGLVWRIWGGLTLALGLYAIVRPHVRASAAAVIVTLLLADAGLMFATPAFRSVRIAIAVLTGQSLSELRAFPMVFPQWRIITPAANIFSLLLNIILMQRARDRPTRLNLVLAGLSVGLLFHTYFYYWTAAGLALALCFVLDAGHRRIYFHSGWIGGLVGLPVIVAGMQLKRAGLIDWMARSSTFLPIPRTSGLTFPKLGILVAVVGMVWCLRSRRDLLYLWALGVAGLLLLNHQAVTGLEIQNFHWTYVWGPCLTLLAVLLVVGALAQRWSGPWSRTSLAATAVFVGLTLATAFWLRGVESLQSGETVTLMDAYGDYRAQRQAPDWPRLEPNGVLAGDHRFVDYAVGLENLRPLFHYAAQFSNTISDDDYDDRMALNSRLAGQSRADFRAEQERELAEGWGPWQYDAARRDARLAHRLSAYDTASADPAPALLHFNVRYLAVRPDLAPPESADPKRPLNWTLLQRGPHWTLWERSGR